MGSLEGKVFVITGASSGIGLATAHLLAARGASVSLADLQEEGLQSASASIKKSSPSAVVLIYSVNVTKRQNVEAWLDATISKFGKLDGAVNAAGVVNKAPIRVQDMDDEEWERVMSVNINGIFICMSSQLKRMKVEEGSIINVSSVAGFAGVASSAHYAASKHAVIGLTKSVAKEVGERKIRVNCVAPGPVDTPMIEHLKENMNQSMIPGLPISRFAQPEEVASLIAFLLGGESKYITGSVYAIDGGYLA